MPSYLDFNTTSTFRDFLISKTLQRPDGPQTFTSGNYRVQNLSNMANVDPGDVDDNRVNDLAQIRKTNVFIPDNFDIIENINTLPINGNLGLYPYFEKTNDGLIGILTTDNYDTESALFRFAANNIRNNPDGPVQARISQNLTAATVGRVRLADALTGNEATAINIVTGRESIIEKNYKITVAKTAVGKAIDFVQTVVGVEFPWSEIPGDYLSNPRNPIENRREPRTELGAVLQDVTGALGSMIGINRKPKSSRKPSDLMIEYMGQGQKQILYDNLSYSKYAPNYTTTARSQNSSKIFNLADRAAQGVNRLLGTEAPRGVAYIGDDRGDDVKYATNDFNDNKIRGSYYMSLMFDPVQSELFEKQKNITEGGTIGGKLAWIGKNSRNELGANNAEWQSESGEFNDTVSTKYGFRDSSIMGKTQEILDSMPLDGASSRSHVGNAIDQTSRIFREGESMISRGSAIKYVDKFGEETGVEYCRVWTKDRAYYNYSDTMKRTGNIRKFDDSVMSTPWNLNIAPMSNGDREFEGFSTNIFKQGDGFYAKKYMFSIENLAWKTSNTPGFTYNDLPYCERGANGGRVMWFPPYDLKVSEQNSARWTDNTFLGRPEPIYTYSDTSRSGQISFKVVVDHPSVLNLLVREHFRNMSDEEADNYINAFFAGCEELDFYDLIRRYTHLDRDDIKLIKWFLEKGKDPKETIKYRTEIEPVEIVETDTDTNDEVKQGEKISSGQIVLKYENDIPGPRLQTVTSPKKYSDMWTSFYPSKATYETNLESALNTLSTATVTAQIKKEKDFIFGNPDISITAADIQTQKTKIGDYFEESQKQFESYTGKTATLKQDLVDKKVQNITLKVESSCSSVASGFYNEKLSLRRSHSIIQDFFDKISNGSKPEIKWVSGIDRNIEANNGENDVTIVVRGKGIVIKREYPLRDFGYDTDGKLVIDSINWGENFTGKGNNPDQICVGKEFQSQTALKVYTPIAYFCRQSRVDFEYVKEPEKTPEKPTPKVPDPVTRIVPDGTIKEKPSDKKPRIDPMKRIIMKTLSECYYFKKLEEDSPLAFKSLREKLKYFHPGFHSTTPEGLNSRLTFLLQCVRPGDTIPIKGLTDVTDLNARNTSFGPPPICVLRVGDFYHSKIAIRDVNITFDEAVWDLNPEGIGVQPMIANVSLQVNFIGGHGLAKPVERLQNALSSNFYANTEMYDERSISTNETIGGKKAEEFTKEFLEDLQKSSSNNLEKDNPTQNEITKGSYIGVVDGENLTYHSLVDDVFTNTVNYFKKYEGTYNKVLTNYGVDVTTMLLSPTYRTIKEYDVYSSVSSTASSTIELFGLHKKTFDLPVLQRGMKMAMVENLDSNDICQVLGFDKELTAVKVQKANELLYPFIVDLIETKLNELTDDSPVTELESARDELVKVLDKVNYIVKYGKDVTIDEKTDEVKSVTLSGFTYDMLYNEYDKVFDYINKNSPILYEDLTSTINFNSPVVDNATFSNVMKVFLYDTQVQTDLLKVLEVDTILYPPQTVKKLGRKLKNFVHQPKEKKFKFGKDPKRRRDTDISHKMSTVAVVTDSNNISDAQNMFSTKVDVVNKLNYYKP